MGHMEPSYTVALEKDALGPRRDVLRAAFGAPATNERIVVDADAALKGLIAAGGLRGELLGVNGPASMPASFTLCHGVGHLYGAVAVFDPKLSGYVVAVSHHPDYPLGRLILEEVQP
jgi:CRISPR-associated protein Csx3